MNYYVSYFFELKFQIEFIYRLDYVWQRQLDSEQEEANTTKLVNELLLQNILPLHVGKANFD
jgi:hypothetical protein